MKKNYTKELTVLATLALFAPWANAQVDVDNVNVIGGVQNPGAITVNGDVAIEPAPSVTPAPVPVPIVAGLNPNIIDPDPLDGVTPVATTLNGTSQTKEDLAGSGVTLETNGDVTLAGNSGVSETVELAVVTQFDVDNGTGVPDPTTQTWQAGYYTNGSGEIVQVSEFATAVDDAAQAAEDALAPGSTPAEIAVARAEAASAEAGNFMFNPIADPAFTSSVDETDLRTNIAAFEPDDALFDGITGANGTALVQDSPIAGTGGNLQVGGDANVNGVLSLADAGPDNELGTPDDGPVVVADVGAAITGNTSDIGSNATDIGSNATDIGSNATDIATNATDIATNSSNIATNSTNIAANATDIGSNATDIGSNATDIATNSSNIATNSTNIAANATNIATNSTNIATNSTNIATNSTNIATNSTNIASNDTAIQQEIADRSALIRDVGPNADGNQIVRIGDNSLVTEELGGTQRLRAENGSGDEIPIRFDGSQGVFVDNFIEVTAPDSPAEFTTNSSGAGSQLPSTEAGTATTTPVVTVLGTTTGEQVDGASGGVLIESNGDVTLSQAGGQESSVEFLQAVSFDVANPGEPNEGLAIAGTERYVAGYENSTGDFVTLSPEFTTQAELDNWIATSDISDSAFDPIRQVQTLEGSGGNLTVGGNAFISGLQSSYNPDGDIEVEFDTVNSAINANGSAIAANSSAIAENSTRISDNEDAIEENARGIAMVAALQNSTVLPGMTHALDVGAAHFEGETGMSLNYSRRINENVQINFGAASTTDFEESVIRAGVGVQW